MTNHFHLVLKTPEPNLSKGMHWLNSNTPIGSTGRMAVAAISSRAVSRSSIEEGSYFAEVLRYVVLNPVRAKMCERPEEHRWSSYRASAGLEGAPEWLDVVAVHRLFGPDAASAQPVLP